MGHRDVVRRQDGRAAAHVNAVLTRSSNKNRTWPTSQADVSLPTAALRLIKRMVRPCRPNHSSLS